MRLARPRRRKAPCQDCGKTVHGDFGYFVPAQDVAVLCGNCLDVRVAQVRAERENDFPPD